MFSHDVVDVQTRDRVRRDPSRTINKNDNSQFQEINVYIKIKVHDLWLWVEKGRIIVLRSSRYASTRARWHLRTCIAD